MPVLHTVNKSPFEKNALDSCLSHALDGSTLLLIEDGVYAAMRASSIEPRIRRALKRLRIHVLENDCRARGISEDALIEGVGSVDDAGFVDLVVEHDNVQAWL
ncbi:sulfurtransferase complex subunit TusB [Thioalkalivibrio sp. HK1]|uniref:sulfurtransferase complex subunit TusB n=1 Tax=Thioalkalivibrio sp. HK1 TaxID=1469245 RepID=UPI000471F1DC|nr:sulfurtransferase complex subunit TusB [Thioalkalivibrio sp. HK1]